MGEELQNRTPGTPGNGQQFQVPIGYTTPKPDGRKRKRRDHSRSFGRNILELLAILAAAAIIAYFLQAFVVKPFQIPSESMNPTLQPGDRVLVNRLAYKFGSKPKRGDIIVFQSPDNPDVDFIKRVIAVSGETIEIQRGSVKINGEPVTESYVKTADAMSFRSQTVPEGTVFVMGDNRPDSQDSRYWRSPWLQEGNIIGKYMMTYWPPDRLGFK
mgnify:CR=1 FL=1